MQHMHELQGGLTANRFDTDIAQIQKDRAAILRQDRLQKEEIHHEEVDKKKKGRVGGKNGNKEASADAEDD